MDAQKIDEILERLKRKEITRLKAINELLDVGLNAEEITILLSNPEPLYQPISQ